MPTFARKTVVLVAMVIVAFGAAVPANIAAAGEIPRLPRLVTRAQFLKMGSLLSQRALTTTQGDAAENYVASLCNPTQFAKPYAFYTVSFEQVTALEYQLQRAKQACSLDEGRLEFERGFLVASMTSMKAITDKLPSVSTDQESDFCSFLKVSKPLTKPLVLNALEKAKIIKNSSRGAVGLGISLVISNCVDLLDVF
jgi:hypothetical protein